MKLEDLMRVSNNTHGRIFDEAVNKYPQREAFVFQSDRVRYNEAGTRVNRLAKGLLRLGVKQGDHVAVWMTNNLEWVYSLFALAKIGAIIVPINTRFKASELEYNLLQSDVNTLIMKDNFLQKINALEILEELCPELSSCEPGGLKIEKFPMLKNVICLGSSRSKGMYSFDKVMDLGAGHTLDDQLAKATARVQPDDIVSLIYTSGTTGLPKASLGTHRGWLFNCIHCQPEYLGFTEGDRILCGAQFATGQGYNFPLMSTCCGATLIIMETFDGEEALKLIHRERVNASYIMVAAMVRMMLDHPNFSKYDLSSFRGTVLGGMLVNRELIEDMQLKMGLKRIFNHYGMVEIHGAATITRPGSIEELTETVGHPHPHVQLKIVDFETGKELPYDHDGEICIKGAIPEIQLAKGYYKMPEKTAEVIDEDGWYHTSDIGQIRKKDGCLKITGRLEEMINVGGFKVFPAEVESFILRNPKVNRVAVVGIPDHRLGEVPIAFIILKQNEIASEAEIIDFCRGKVADIKVPRYVKFIAEFPTTLQGKVQKFKLKEWAIKELRLE